MSLSQKMKIEEIYEVYRSQINNYGKNKKWYDKKAEGEERLFIRSSALCCLRYF